MNTHFWQSTRDAGSRRCRLTRQRATIPLVVLALACGLTLGGLPEAAGGLPGYFTDVKLVPNVNWLPGEPHYSMGSRITRDGLEMYFVRVGVKGEELDTDSADIWVARRNSTAEDFGEPHRLGEGVNSTYEEHMGSISSDGLTLYFGRRTSEGWNRIYVATRETKEMEFDNAVPLERNERQSRPGQPLCVPGRAYALPSPLGTFDLKRRPLRGNAI